MTRNTANGCTLRITLCSSKEEQCTWAYGKGTTTLLGVLVLGQIGLPGLVDLRDRMNDYDLVARLGDFEILCRQFCSGSSGPMQPMRSSVVRVYPCDSPS